jgi:hypothetical protein
MKAKVIIPIVAFIALLLYFLSNGPSSEESFQSSAPAEIGASEQIEENERLIEAAVETLPEAGVTATLALLRYDPRKDPLYSQEAK